MKVLVADDSAVIRAILAKTLRNAGYDVTAVDNGTRAAEELRRDGGPRLALLDWEMPGLDGPALCRLIREEHTNPYIHMILVTSKESKQDVVAGLESGADDYLIKPCDPEELKARLRTGERILQLEDKLVEAREDLRFKATHDPLTGLFNRGVIIELLDREIARTRREGGGLTLIMCDLDHFKQINDTYGHQTGDDVLQEVARRLLASVRSYDFVGRYGGEEFLMVLNNCNTVNALVRAEEIRQAICSAPIKTRAGALNVTTSIGIFPSECLPAAAAVDMLHGADTALYDAKAAGRNCVRQASTVVHSMPST